MSYTTTSYLVREFPYRYTRDGTTLTLRTDFIRSYSQTKSGSKVEDWKSKIAQGLNASSDYTLDRCSVIESRPGVLLNTYSIYPEWAYQDKYAPYHHVVTGYYDVLTKPDHLVVDLAKPRAESLSKIYKKIESEQQRMNSLATLAEFGDVVRQFGKPFDAIIDLTNRRLNRLALEAKGLKGSTAFRKVKFAEIVASTWLEYSFGLAPLIDDTKAAAEALARFDYEKSGEQRFRSRVVSREASRSVVHTVDNFLTLSAPSQYFKLQRIKKIETEFRVQYVVGLDATPVAAFGSNERLLGLLGFTPANFITAAWEVVPWSWLVDYFFNVQQILSAAVTNTSKVNWVNKTETYVTVRTLEWPCMVKETNANWATQKYYSSASGGLGYDKVRRTTMTRSTNISLGVPPLTVSNPFEDYNKLANMAAVLISRRPSSSALWLI